MRPGVMSTTMWVSWATCCSLQSNEHPGTLIELRCCGPGGLSHWRHRGLSGSDPRAAIRPWAVKSHLSAGDGESALRVAQKTAGCVVALSACGRPGVSGDAGPAAHRRASAADTVLLR